MTAKIIQAAGRVIWITGLSGAGKSSLASEIALRLRALGDVVVMLDGDELREVFCRAPASADNHSRASRLVLAMQYAHLCRLIAAQGLTVVVATISLYRDVHAWNRSNLPGYFEVYLKVPLHELRRRDPKGIYRRFDAKEINDVVGLDLPFDEPVAPDWVSEFDPQKSAELMANEFFKVFRRRA